MLNLKSISSLYLLIIALLVAYSRSKVNKEIENRIDEYLSDPQHDLKKLRIVLESGSMNGHFKTDELFSLFFYLQKKYPEYVKTEEIGKTVEERPIYVFKLKKQASDSNVITKNKILFTGNHHARELLTVTICLKIFIESLHSLLYKSENSSFWTFNDLLIVPIINIDSHTLISNSYGTTSWDENKYKRKNMNRQYCS